MVRVLRYLPSHALVRSDRSPLGPPLLLRLSTKYPSGRSETAAHGGEPVAGARSRSPKKAMVVISQLRRLHRKGHRSVDGFALLRTINALPSSSWSTSGGEQVHALIVRLGLQSNVFLQSSLVNWYSRMGRVGDARRVFDDISERNVVCWTSLVSAYVRNKKPRSALEAFGRMQLEGVEPDGVAVTTALSACADVGALDIGKRIHDYVRGKEGFRGDTILCNALIDMYAKCGDVDTCLRLFRETNRRDVTTWTSVIMGLALHGRADEALAVFAQMREQGRRGRSEGVVPNKVTFLGVLLACSHAGLVEEGRRHLESMATDYRLEPEMSHVGCMVDLLCRAGLLVEALGLVERMPVPPNAVIWRTLLSASSLHGDVCIAVRARRGLLELESRRHAGDDVAMSNAFATAEMWKEKERIRRGMRKCRRIPGSSVLEAGIVNNLLHTS